MLTLSRDAQAINAVVNHPAVRPFVGPAEIGALDMTALVGSEEHLFPFGEHGGFAFIWTAPHCREVHTFFTPEGRGAWAAQARTEAIDLAREQGTRTLWTRIPPDSPHVEAFAVGGGMKPTGEVLEMFGKPHAIYSMELN